MIPIVLNIGLKGSSLLLLLVLTAFFVIHQYLFGIDHAILYFRTLIRMIILHRLFALLTIFLLLSNGRVAASHSVGADITYTCLGGNQYEVSLSFYRDCAGISAPTNVTINVESISCNQFLAFTLNPIPGTGIEISPVCPTASTTCNGGSYTGIQEWIYRGVITLPANCVDWLFSFQTCCRNSAITNISSPGSEDFFVYASLNNISANCNSSPTFSNKPVPFACVGQQFCFNHGAFDADGDSLVYSMITPLGIDLNDPIVYNPPFSATQPVSSNPPVSFNAATGDICMTPTAQQVTVFAVLVKEYRNGVLIGSVERDIQLYVVNCTNTLPTATGINGTNNFSTTICADATYCFNVLSSDPDPGQSTFLTWDFGIGNGSFNTSASANQTGTFCWTPTQADISTIPYCFTVTVTDNNCPYVGTQIYSYCLTVTGITADAGIDQLVNCNQTAILTGVGAGGVTGAFNYSWSNGSNTSTTSGGPGTYVLSVADGDCIARDTVEVLPAPDVPVALFNYTNICSNAPIPFTDASTLGIGSIVDWQWFFGDGDSSSTQNPSHLYPSFGNYVCTLVVTTAAGCMDTLIQNVIYGGSVPSASFTANTVCLGDTTSLLDNSTTTVGVLNSWQWFYNGTGIGSGANASYYFNSSGNFAIKLVVANDVGCYDTVQTNVIVNPLPAVSAGSDATICLGASTSLTASGALNYLWSPINLTAASINVTPVINTEYFLQGTDLNGCINVDTVNITVAPNPTANAGSDVDICSGNFATLTASGGGVYSWSSGGNTSSISVSPAVTTNYTVTVTDINGCTDTDVAVVNVIAAPTAFAGNDAAICLGDFITLTASGVGSYAWSPAGGSQNSFSVNPANTTTYTLIVTNPTGCSDTDAVTISVNQLPVANAGIDTAICYNSMAHLNGIGGVAYLWQPGNFNTSTINVSPANSTNYVLTVTDGNGCIDQDSVYLIVNPLPPANAGTDVAICIGDATVLTASGGVAYLWNPGASNQPQIGVSPQVSTNYTLTVTDLNGCIATDEVYVLVNNLPVVDAGVDIAVCDQAPVQLDASGGINYIWQPGNYTTPSINFNATTTQNFNVTVTDANGCINTDNVLVMVNPNPVATFSNLPAICEDQNLQFNDQSIVGSGIINQYNWDFGNGMSSNDQHPLIYFDQAANLNVTLTVVTDSGCSASISQPLTIHHRPDANILANDVCDQAAVTLVNNSAIGDGTPISYTWLLGDGTISNDESPVKVYNTYGAYNIVLLAISQNQCSDTAYDALFIHPNPIAKFTHNATCEDEMVTLSNQSQLPLGLFADWFWETSDGGTYTLRNPSHQFNNWGTYDVRLIAFSDFGCKDTTTETIQIDPKPLPDFSTENVCVYDTALFSNFTTIPFGGISQYTWTFGDNQSANMLNPSHKYQNAGTYTISLSAISDSGCRNVLVKPDFITIHEKPVVSFTDNSASIDDIAPLVNFENYTGLNGLYSWSFGDGNTSSLYAPQHYYTQAGIYDVTLIINDENNCRDTSLRRIEILKGKTLFIPNAFTPNGDGINDFFNPVFINMKSVRVDILNRWGALLKTYNALDDAWDGSFNGSICENDVYICKINAIAYDGQIFKQVGTVTLVK
ncbi:MAG: hypothetical protein RIQ89_1145 [Bacteroidota bacterium]|jgi:gliding motility-associated-like protein